MRGNGDVLCIRAAVSETEDFVVEFETALVVGTAETDDCARELDAHCRRGLGWEGVVAFALEKVHAVEAEGFDFHEGLCRCWLGDRRVVVQLWERVSLGALVD